MQVKVFLASVGVMLMYGLSALGWGLMTQHFLGGGKTPGWAYTTALGLAVLIFIGGILNIVGVVSTQMLDVLTGLGLTASIGFMIAALKRRGKFAALAPSADAAGVPSRNLQWLLCAIVLMPCAFLVASVMPTLAFNPYDDLHTYFTRPVWMLQTGTIRGNAFDVLGLDSLGAQAFIDAPVMAHFGPAFVNGVDGIFCFVLSGFLLIELARRLEIGGVTSLLALLAFITIHPQIVNISAVYSGTLMALSVVYASILLLEPDPAGLRQFGLGQTMQPALFTAALLALKTTFALFVAAYWVLFFAVLIVTGGQRKLSLTTAFLILLASMAMVAPWAALWVPNYLSALKQTFTIGGQAGMSLPGDGSIADLFSKQAIWAGSLFDYDVLAILLACACGLALWVLFRRPDTRSCMALIPAAALAGCSVGTFLVLGKMFEAETAVRYSAPTLIAALPTTAILLLATARSPHRALHKALPATIAAALVAVLVVFSGAFWQRARAAAYGHTLVSFPIAEAYYGYMAGALGAPARDWISGVQMATAEGATILAWTSVPFHLDFRRNRILVVSEPGLINPWLNLPTGAEPGVLREYLSSIGVRYVFLEYGGPGVKPDGEFMSYANAPIPLYGKIGRANLNFRHGLLALADESRMIQSAPGMVLYDITDSSN